MPGICATPGPADLSEVVCFRPSEAKTPWRRFRGGIVRDGGAPRPMKMGNTRSLWRYE